MQDEKKSSIARRFEEVLVRNLGEVGRFLMYQQLKAIGKDPSTFTKEDVPAFLKGLTQDFEKVIGYGVRQLEKDLLHCLKEER